MEYLGAPTFAYKVGGYHIDKNGTVTGTDNLDLEDALYKKGYSAAKREYDEPDTYESGLGGLGAAPDFEDLELTEDEGLGFEHTLHEDYQDESGMQESDDWSYESDTLTIEIPLDGFTDESIGNLEKLIASKANLIKKAIGVDGLPIGRTSTTLQFPWFSFQASVEEVAAYTRFVTALCNAAKQQKRVTAREKATDNEKFSFRVFLIRLGFVGEVYKTTRKILLRNLCGNSAFKNGGPNKSADAEENEVSHE
jgi:hypothetical protein